MHNRKEYLIFLAAGGMEFFWIYALISFIFSLGEWPSLPPVQAAGTFCLAVIITMLSSGKGWRVIGVLAVQAVSLTISVLRLIFLYGTWSGPFLHRAWLVDLFTGSRESAELLMLILAALSGIFLWWGGLAFARRERSYNNICSRFDLGIGMLFLLLFIGAAGGTAGQAVNVMLIPFFFFGVVSIGLARNRGNGQKNFILGYQGIGLILTFVGLVFFAGAALLLLSLPFLTTAAETGFAAVRNVTEPLTPYFLNFIIFIFGFGSRLREDPPTSGSTGSGGVGGAGTAPADSSPASLLETIISWGLLGLMGLAAAILLGWGLWRLIVLLQRPTAKSHAVIGWSSRWGAVLNFLLMSLALLWRHLSPQRRERSSEVMYLYRKLKKWGQAAGMPAHPWETPAEYGMRLGRGFPELTQEIRLVVDCFNREFYGGDTIDHSDLGRIKGAWKSIASPRNWFAVFSGICYNDLNN